MKRCYKCNQEKDESEFCKNKNFTDGLNCYCKYCNSKKWWEKNNKDSEIIYDEFLKIKEYKKKLNDTKICSKCNQEKNKNEFNKHINHNDGLSSECKICKNKSRNKIKEKIYAKKVSFKIYMELH